jgi:hypothetical protein
MHKFSIESSTALVELNNKAHEFNDVISRQHVDQKQALLLIQEIRTAAGILRSELLAAMDRNDG